MPTLKELRLYASCDFSKNKITTHTTDRSGLIMAINMIPKKYVTSTQRYSKKCFSENFKNWKILWKWVVK